ncbi:hypothetical protein FRX31_035091, partial [Thalictrum thalictroides]
AILIQLKIRSQYSSVQAAWTVGRTGQTMKRVVFILALVMVSTCMAMAQARKVPMDGRNVQENQEAIEKEFEEEKEMSRDIYPGSSTSSSYNHHTIPRQNWGKGDGGDNNGNGGG